MALQIPSQTNKRAPLRRRIVAIAQTDKPANEKIAPEMISTS
jgi:hypothetical protein